MKIVIDLDGVAVDFVTAAMSRHAVEAHNYPVEAGWDIVKACNILREQVHLPPVTVMEFWGNLSSLRFWLDLKPYPGAIEFVQWLDQTFEEVVICTSPTSSPASSGGKHQWIKDFLPDFQRRFFIGTQKHWLANSDTILIDDYNANCDMFIKAGGKALLVPRPWNTYQRHSQFEELKGTLQCVWFGQKTKRA